MAVFFLYFVKSDLSSLRYRTRVHWTSHILQGTRKTRPCLTGHPVYMICYLDLKKKFMYSISVKIWSYCLGYTYWTLHTLRSLFKNIGQSDNSKVALIGSKFECMTWFWSWRLPWFFIENPETYDVYVKSLALIYDGVRQVSGLRKEPVVSVENPTLIPTSHWKRGPRPSRRRLRPSRCEFCTGVLCTELHERVGVLYFSGMWGLVWGSPRRLQVPYVIPRPDVPRHITLLAVLDISSPRNF